MGRLEDLYRTLRDRLRARPQYRRVYADPRTRTFANLLIDLEDSPHARAVVLGELRERELRGDS